jgi:ABC-type dipeptide transport system, periplasmic component
MTTQEYKWMYDFALLTKQQLEESASTSICRWWTGHPGQAAEQLEGVRCFHHGHRRLLRSDACVFLTPSWPGWTSDEDIQRIQSELARETDPKKRMALWEQQTRQFYEKVPVIRYGDLFGLRAARNTVKDFNEKTERVRFYNVWLEK